MTLTENRMGMGGMGWGGIYLLYWILYCILKQINKHIINNVFVLYCKTLVTISIKTLFMGEHTKMEKTILYVGLFEIENMNWNNFRPTCSMHRASKIMLDEETKNNNNHWKESIVERNKGFIYLLKAYSPFNPSRSFQGFIREGIRV